MGEPHSFNTKRPNRNQRIRVSTCQVYKERAMIEVIQGKFVTTASGNLIRNSPLPIALSTLFKVWAKPSLLLDQVIL